MDHLVVAASTLEEGCEYLADKLGAAIPPGGRHEFMATHNRVMTLGDGVYLEIIAIDPEGVPPAHPRWFALDDPLVRASLANGPRLLTWAVNTSNLHALCAAASVPLGKITAAQRGELKWQVTVAEDGRLPASGCIPLCIQWQIPFHPASRMVDLGCRFKSLSIAHPRPDWLADVLTGIGAAHCVAISGVADSEMSCLSAVLQTPQGLVTLDSSLQQL